MAVCATTFAVANNPKPTKVTKIRGPLQTFSDRPLRLNDFWNVATVKHPHLIVQDGSHEPDWIIHDTRMKLKELLQKVSFDDIVPYILACAPEHTTQIPYYKEAYDILLHTEAAETDERITVEWVRDDEELCGEAPYIHIGHCEGDYWTTNLGKELVLGNDVELSDEELAGRCMWSLTFYGFRPEEFSYWGEPKPQNRYAEQAEKLSNKQFDNYARTKNGVSSGDRTPYALTEEEWDVFEKRRRHRNRMKRMRDHRQEKRIKTLERKANVEQAILRILSMTDAVSREQLTDLFDTQQIQEQNLQSRAYDRNCRMTYLWESLTKYAVPDGHPCTKMILVLSTAPDVPLTDEERLFFDRIVALYAGEAEVLAAVGTQTDLGEEAALFILKSY